MRGMLESPKECSGILEDKRVGKDERLKFLRHPKSNFDIKPRVSRCNRANRQLWFMKLRDAVKQCWGYEVVFDYAFDEISPWDRAILESVQRQGRCIYFKET